jgi:hypothetical protein
MLIATGLLGLATTARATTMSEPLDTADFSSNPALPDSLPAGTDLVNGLLSTGDMLDAFRFTGLTPGDLRTFDWTLNPQAGSSITILFLNSAFNVLGGSDTSGTLNVIVPLDGLITVWVGLDQAAQGVSSYNVSLQPIPEPASFGGVGIGLVVLAAGWNARLKRKA